MSNPNEMHDEETRGLIETLSHGAKDLVAKLSSAKSIEDVESAVMSVGSEVVTQEFQNNAAFRQVAQKMLTGALQSKFHNMVGFSGDSQDAGGADSGGGLGSILSMGSALLGNAMHSQDQQQGGGGNSVIEAAESLLGMGGNHEAETKDHPQEQSLMSNAVEKIGETLLNNVLHPKK